MSERTGRCLCGAVRYRIAAEPGFTRICWCRDCQHIAGNGTVNMLVPAAALDVSGATSAYTSMADSGNQITRRFCPNCGCHLFADSSGRPHYTVVRAGTLDDPSSVTPSTNIWTSSAPGWACMDTNLERVERQPAPPQNPSGAVRP
ncbi:MAG: GFA family protein [Proteobacteria bacterium]|nr:GFA family protein [Pseudomonadota bacterium]